MNVLFVLEYFPPHVGGVETLFDNLTRKLAGRGNKVTVLTSRVPGSEGYEESEGRRIFRTGVPFRHAFTLAFPKAARLAREADVIHTTTFSAAGTTWFARKLTKRPVIATFHEVWDKQFLEFQGPITGRINRFLEGRLCKAYANDTLTCPSEATKRAMTAKGMKAENIHVIPHGIDHDVFNDGVKPMRGWDGPTYLCFGRAGVSKGVEYLVRAVPQIAAAVPGSRLILMLSRDKRYEKIVAEVRKLGITDKVFFLQPQSTPADVAGVIKSCDVTVVPSLSEGFGFNAVEAQACGVPVVATTAGSLPEVVKGGILVEPRSPGKIAEAVIMLLKDRSLRERLGRAGAEHARTYTWDRATDAYVRLYENINA